MFLPKRIIFEKDVLKFDIAKNILTKFKDKKNIELIILSSNRFKEHIPGEDFAIQYQEGKNTLVVGTKKGEKFQTCKPSAHYQLPLVTGCMGQCEYCYLNTNLGEKPFVKVNVNTDEILDLAENYIEERLPQITIFEGAATSDPIPVEPYTHSLKTAIEYFGKSEHGRFRFVTKYNDIESLMHIPHNGHTEVRFSINTNTIINEYEHYTASRDKRIQAGIQMAESGYPVGFLIAPVFIYENWKEDYYDLLLSLKKALPSHLKNPITFEIISHRYTTVAKNRILQVFPNNTLPMKDEERKYKYGQFGYGKFVYEKETLNDMKDFFSNSIDELFTNIEIKYII